MAVFNNMVKEIMKKFTSPGLRGLFGKTGFLTLGLMVLVILMGNSGRAQGSFATAQVLSGDSGIVTVDNTTFTPDTNAPTIANLIPQHTIWFQWSTTNSGEMELDTIGSLDDIFGAQLDTVLGVFTGANLNSLNLVSANDNLYPISQFNEVGQNVYATGDMNYLDSSNLPVAPPHFFLPAQGTFGLFAQPFGGPSGLRFNAVAGTT